MNELSFLCNRKDTIGIRLQRIWTSSNIFIPDFVYNSLAYRCNEKGDKTLSKARKDMPTLQLYLKSATTTLAGAFITLFFI